MFPGLHFVHCLEPNDAAVLAHLSLKNLPDKIAGDIPSGKARHERIAGYPFREGDFDAAMVRVPRCSIVSARPGR